MAANLAAALVVLREPQPPRVLIERLPQLADRLVQEGATASAVSLLAALAAAEDRAGNPAAATTHSKAAMSMLDTQGAKAPARSRRRSQRSERPKLDRTSR